MNRLSIAVAITALASLAGTAAAATPGVRAVLGRGAPQVTGPRAWQPGWQEVAVTSRTNDQELTLISFRKGYGYAQFVADGKLAHGRTPTARAALQRIFANTVFDGGADLFRGQSATVAFHVAAGTYYLGEMTSRPRFVPIHVAGATSALPATPVSIDATDSSFRTHGSLSSNGAITIRNTGRRNHRLNLIPVKAGTTRAELGAYLTKDGASDNAPAPPFALDGPQIGTADLSPGARMQLRVSLPAGTYAAIDLDRDPLTGHARALDGMYTIVTVG